MVLTHLQETASSPRNVEAADSSFTFTSKALLTNSPINLTHDYILDINRYIPVGCLRIEKQESGLKSDVWMQHSSWHAFAHPRDFYKAQGETYLENQTQEKLLSSPVVQPYRGLCYAGWIRMEFKVKDEHFGQIRIYILPDDVGRSSLDRQQVSLRKAMLLLIAQIDIAKSTWNGEWSEETPVEHIDSALDGKAKEDVSLFYLFNNLPSPKPDPEIVADPYAQDAMNRILDSKIEGLTTKMHSYQRRSAALMLQREVQPSQIIDPRLRHVVDQQGAMWYIDLDAGMCLRGARTYETARGGILAETMGLGKTLICLALILASREMSSQIPVEYSVGTVPVRPKTGSLMDMAAATIGRTGTPWKSQLATLEEDLGYSYPQRIIEALQRGAGFYHIPSPVPRRESSRNPIVVPPQKVWLTTATIVVVPPNLVQQWRHEIKKHTVGLKVLVMNNNKTKLPPAQELAEFDLILFSKPRFDKEAKDGSDEQGRRRTTTSSVCRCPYIRNTRERDCTCFRDEDVYRSPLKDLHFKRLITDEGHNYGNASNSSKTEALVVVEFLQLSSRWIVSGTPTQGLYGVEVGLNNSESASVASTPLRGEEGDSTAVMTRGLSRRLLEMPELPDTASEKSSEQEKAFYKQERKDLEKLGNIATMYLKARPWANTVDDNDVASWSQHVMQPRHGSKSHGNMDCLKSTLEGMIIRHRPGDVNVEVTLPPLHQTVVYLEGSMQDKLSLNMFSMMIVSNAVTSERKDNDYFFHPRQRKALQELVSNLRQASFFWSGYTRENVQTTIGIARRFMDHSEVPVTAADVVLLGEAVGVGETFLANNISEAISSSHEMPMYVQNEFPEDIRAAWALDGMSSNRPWALERDPGNPTLMGATMVHNMQGLVSKQIWSENPMEGLVEEGKKALRDAHMAHHPPPSTRPPKALSKALKLSKKAGEQAAPALAGGVSVGDGSSLKKRSRAHFVGTVKPISAPSSNLSASSISLSGISETFDAQTELTERTKPTSVLKRSKMIEHTLAPNSPLASTAIVSTSSAKLSYLLDRIITYQSTEKIIVFYEADNAAYYIAQALEILGIEHLIYAKTLPNSRRADYVVTFNQTETFRVLLMDVSQAAFGLDMSSASRVFFVNPVFSPQIEAQAVKRAHRIGQTKPVFVETLVLRGSIEEVILERRRDMSTEEHNKCKSILDDQKMYDWIRNAHFLPLPLACVPGPDQMAKLEVPQLLFVRGSTKIGERDPDAGLVLDSLSPTEKGKKKCKKVSFLDDEPAEEDGDLEPTASGDDEAQVEVEAPKSRKRKRKSVSFQDRNTEAMQGETARWYPQKEGLGLYTYANLYPHPDKDKTSQPPIMQTSLTSSTAKSPFGSASDFGSSTASNSSFASASCVRSMNIFAGESSSRLDQSLRLPSTYSENSSKYRPIGPAPSSAIAPQPASAFPSKTMADSLQESDEIEYSTPRPRTKRMRTQVLGVKMPSGEYTLPPRNYGPSSTPASTTSSGSLTLSPASTPSSSLGLGGGETTPTKAQKARLDADSLLVKMKLHGASTQLPEIEKKSDAWRAEIGRVGCEDWEERLAANGGCC